MPIHLPQIASAQSKIADSRNAIIESKRQAVDPVSSENHFHRKVQIIKDVKSELEELRKNPRCKKNPQCKLIIDSDIKKVSDCKPTKVPSDEVGGLFDNICSNLSTVDQILHDKTTGGEHGQEEQYEVLDLVQGAEGGETHSYAITSSQRSEGTHERSAGIEQRDRLELARDTQTQVSAEQAIRPEDHIYDLPEEDDRYAEIDEESNLSNVLSNLELSNKHISEAELKQYLLDHPNMKSTETFKLASKATSNTLKILMTKNFYRKMRGMKGGGILSGVTAAHCLGKARLCSYKESEVKSILLNHLFYSKANPVWHAVANKIINEKPHNDSQAEDIVLKYLISIVDINE